MLAYLFCWVFVGVEGQEKAENVSLDDTNTKLK